MEALHCCLDWLEGLHDAVASGQGPAFVPRGLAAVDPEDPERVVRMAEVAKLDLPRPLQTLLDALRDVKMDMAREQVRALVNLESRIAAFCESRVAFACDQLDQAAEAIREANQDVWALVLQGDPNFERAMQKFGPGLAPSKWTKVLLDALHDVQTQLQTAALAERPTVLQGVRPEYESIDRAHNAVANSQMTRERLVALATGPLASLFEIPDRAVTTATGHVEQPPERPRVQAAFDRSEALARQKDLQKMLRHLQRSVASARASRDVVYDDIIEGLLWALKRATERPEASTISLEENLADMRTADKKLQKEIALVLQTLTVDKASLDLVLRAIKSQCLAVTQLAAKESATAWTIKLAQWARRLAEASETYLHALRGEPDVAV